MQKIHAILKGQIWEVDLEERNEAIKQAFLNGKTSKDNFSDELLEILKKKNKKPICHTDMTEKEMLMSELSKGKKVAYITSQTKRRTMRELTDEQYNLRNDLLGHCGLMLSHDKSKLDIIYNSNICSKEYGKVWFGDVNIKTKKSLNNLQKFADEIQSDLHILREMDARFDNETNPLYENAVLIIMAEVKS